MGTTGIRSDRAHALFWRTTLDGPAPAADRRAPRLVEAAAAPPIFDGPPRPPRAFEAMVTRGGGTPALAARLWHEGATEAEAIDALTLAMRRPALEDFGPARLLVEVLSWARAEGAIDAARVQQGFHALKDAVVVRPDGVWARAGDGAPLQVSPIERRGGAATAGGLPVGGLFASRQGVLRAVDARGRAGRIVGELGLTQDVASAALTGVSRTFMGAVFESVDLARGLIHAPEATLTGLVHAFGTLPEQAVAVAFAAPEMLARFRRLPPQAQHEIAGQVLGAAILAARGAAAAPRVGASGGPSGGLRLRVGLMETGRGACTAWVKVEGLAGPAAVAGAGGRLGAAGLGASSLGEGPAALLRSRDGDVEDPKVAFANRHHIERRWGDPRAEGASVDELIERLSAGVHPNTRQVYLQMALEYLEAYGALPLADVARLRRALDDAPALQGRLDGWAKRRFREAIADLPDAPTPAARARAQQIRAHAEAAGLSLHQVYRPRSSAPPRRSLSAEAQRAVARLRGGAREVDVPSRTVAEEVLTQYPQLAQTQSWPKWKTKALFDTDFQETFHWDDLRGADGRVQGHGPDNPHGARPHLQIEDANGKSVHVFFPW